MKRNLLCLGVLCICAAAARAQDNAEILARMKAMEERIKSLEAEVATLKSQPAATAPAAAAAPAPVPAPAPAPVEAAQAAPPLMQAPTQVGSTGSASKVFNPDISVIGDFLGAAGNGGPRAIPSLQMHESEVGFQAILDPYARADFFISFSEHGVDLEEGYLTFPALPGGFQLKVGKMRAAFGAVNTLHNHVLPWTDRPLVTQNLVGGEDGIDDAGLSLSRIIPAPGGLFLEGTAQIFRGDSEGVFSAQKRSDVSTVGHLRGYKDVSESTNISLGVSYARGHSELSEPLINQLYGFDATLHYKPLRRGLYHSFVGRTELIWNRNDHAIVRGTPFGYYVSGDYQFARRWFLGGRFDRSERQTDARMIDTGGSIILTYWPSEFSQIRGQLRRTVYSGSHDANELLFQFQFSIGAHGAHPF
jgi:hypothetical protein